MPNGMAKAPIGPRGCATTSYVSRVPFPASGASSAETRSSATGPRTNRLTTLKRSGRTHSNGSSDHSSGMPNRRSRSRWRAFSPVPSRSTAGMPVSRLKRFVSAASGQS